MAQQTINIGASPNDGTGTPLRTAFQYTNSNFSELYTAVGPSGNNIVVPGTATITGDLTVDTNVLKVDTTNNRVGINTATPARPLDIVGSFQSTLGWVLTGTPAGLGAATRYIGGASTTDSWYYNAVTGGSHLWAFGESLAMTLNATGLGVGRSPSYKLDVAGVGNFDQLRVNATSATKIDLVNNTTAVTYSLFNANSVSNGFDGFGIFNGTSYDLRIVSGNVGIGVAPSYLLHTAVASGANRNMARFQVTGASNGLTITWDHATTKMIVNFSNLPTSSAGLASGDLWIDTTAGNTLKVA